MSSDGELHQQKSPWGFCPFAKKEKGNRLLSEDKPIPFFIEASRVIIR
jgi:hypothetical protein